MSDLKLNGNVPIDKNIVLDYSTYAHFVYEWITKHTYDYVIVPLPFMGKLLSITNHSSKQVIVTISSEVVAVLQANEIINNLCIPIGALTFCTKKFLYPLHKCMSIQNKDNVINNVKNILENVWHPRNKSGFNEEDVQFWPRAICKFTLTHFCRLEDLPNDHPLVVSSNKVSSNNIPSDAFESDDLPDHVPCVGNNWIVPHENQSLNDFNATMMNELCKEWKRLCWWRNIYYFYDMEIKSYINRFITIENVKVDCPENINGCLFRHLETIYSLTSEQVQNRLEWNSRECTDYAVLKTEFKEYVNTIKNERLNKFMNDYCSELLNHSSDEIEWLQPYEEIANDFKINVKGITSPNINQFEGMFTVGNKSTFQYKCGGCHLINNK